MDYTFEVYEEGENLEIDSNKINILFVLSGKISLFREKDFQVYNEYSFFLIKPYQSPEFILHSGKIIVLSINKLSFNRFALFNWDNGLEGQDIDNEIIEAYLTTIKSIYVNDNFNADISMIKLINFIRASEYYKNHTILSINPLIKEVIDYIDENYKEPLTVAMIADEFYVNPSYLSRVFPKYMNITLLAYIRKIKMFRLAAEMIFASYPNDLWKEYGYESYETYLKHFKTVFSVPPWEFLSNYKNKDRNDSIFNDTTYKQVESLLHYKPYSK